MILLARELSRQKFYRFDEDNRNQVKDCETLNFFLREKNKNRFFIMHLSYGQDEGGNRKTELWDFSAKNSLIGLDLTNYVEDYWVRVRNSATEN